MSYPNRFSRFHTCDRGTQRITKGEGNVGHREDKDRPFTSEDFLSRADATGVIMWLTLVGEFRADAFWKKFSFPPNVRVSLPPLGPHYVDCMDGDWGGMNSIYWPEIHISKGLRFPLPPMIHQFLHFTRLHPVHVHVNIIHVLLGVCVLNRKYELLLGLKDLLYTYTLKWHNLESYYLIVDAKWLHLVTKLPTTNKNKSQGNVLLFGA